ncbi:MAG: hypothetical protein QNJ00_17400 [Woeseiaceae bacterium]|nr:hypothetical protein [Woeseiaceae bacterium]
MPQSYDKGAAVVILPAVGGGRLRDPELKTWLARSELSTVEQRIETLRAILNELGKPYPADGLAALRMWGQTGDRPTVWMAGADPVYLEPRLDHLCLHAFARTGVPLSELRPLFDHLQQELGDDSAFGFARVGSHGYLSSAAEPIASATMPAYSVDGLVPNDFLPTGPGADRHRGLVSEIEMALHDHPVNLERQTHALPPINSLWIWGGGHATAQTTEPHPPLFSDDALLRGYWLSRTGLAEPWPGNITGCLDEAVAGFVATVPGFDDGTRLEDCLHELKSALESKRLSSLTLLFRDGLRADILRSHRRRFWRRRNPLLEEATKQ